MYYIDSTTQRVVTFDYDLDTGELGRADRLFAEIDPADGLPDGLTVDAEVACGCACSVVAQSAGIDPTARSIRRSYCR